MIQKNIYRTLVICLSFFPILISGCKKDDAPSDEVPEPGIMIDGVTLFEGHEGLIDFPFPVSFNRAFNKDITIHYKTADGIAKAGIDYEAVTNGSIVIPAGKTSGNIVIKVIGNDIREADKTFTVELLSSDYGVILRNSATGYIRNDDNTIKIATTGYEAATSYDGYTLEWQDEFTDRVDPDIWWNQNGDGCPDLCGWGNNESQYYTDRSSNIFIQDGHLVIEARPENYQGKSYTSSKILTTGKKAMRYGRIDIRAQLPYGQGIWPAFWMMPEESKYGGWPSSGEIDIMEMVGHQSNMVHGTVHYGPGPSSIHQTSSHVKAGGGIFNDDFNVFSLVWKEDELIWLVNDQEFKRITPDQLDGQFWPFNEYFYLIINFAVGGNWPGYPDATTLFPQWLVVDYVRYYSANE